MRRFAMAMAVAGVVGLLVGCQSFEQALEGPLAGYEPYQPSQYSAPPAYTPSPSPSQSSHSTPWSMEPQHEIDYEFPTGRPYDPSRPIRRGTSRGAGR